MNVTRIAALLALPLLPLAAQQVISTKAGLVNLVQGEVTVNDAPIVVRNSRFAELKNGDVLRTAEGRAEVLLAPGAFIRLSESSAFRMESNSILNTRLALLDGDALLEVMEFPKDNSLEILIGSDKVSIQKPGLYRLDASNNAVKVFNGEVAVLSGDDLRKVSEGRMITLTGDRLIAKFDRKSGDEFSRWASRRSSYIAMANVSAAKGLYDASSSWNRLGFGSSFGGWIFNPWYGFYTYVPYGRNYFSPFGYTFFSPGNVYAILNPRPSSGWTGDSGSWNGPNLGMGSTPGGFDRRGSAGLSNPGSYSSGGVNLGGPSATSGSVAGAERATGGASAGAARGGSAGGGARSGGSPN